MECPYTPPSFATCVGSAFCTSFVKPPPKYVHFRDFESPLLTTEGVKTSWAQLLIKSEGLVSPTTQDPQRFRGTEDGQGPVVDHDGRGEVSAGRNVCSRGSAMGTRNSTHVRPVARPCTTTHHAMFPLFVAFGNHVAESALAWTWISS